MMTSLTGAAMPSVTYITNTPLLLVAIPALAALLIMLTDDRFPNLREAWTLLAGIANLAVILLIMPDILAGELLSSERYTLVKNVDFFLKIDTAGMIFAALASVLWVATSFYSIGYMRADKKKHQTGYFASFALCISAVMGISFAGNLLTFFVFYEILTIATYPLVIHNRKKEHEQAGRNYLTYTLVSGQIFLIGIIWIYSLTGTTDFRPGGILGGVTDTLALQIIFVLLVIGASVKAGVMPFHGWLPSAMVAPTPVSALLHAVAVVKAGAFAMVRIVGYVFGFDVLAGLGMADYLAWLAAFTILASSIIAISQNNLKRRLAFSTIGQLSYIILGLALLNQQAFMGAMFHMVAHAFMKITLFFCAGAIFINTGGSYGGRKYISQIHGIGRRMPVTMAMFGLAAVGISGLPFIVGFLSKWNIAMGAIAGGQYLFVFVLVASAMLSASYLIPVFILAFFGRNKDFPLRYEVRKDMLLPIVFTGVMSVLLGVYPDLLLNFYELSLRSAEIVARGMGW